ncbi:MULTISPECIES: PTS transporter subunit EIIB [Pseudomonas]|uniref:PTS transporter subunit EIIB n=1 Tax=Pseudomonas hygromyciniae TaxID=2812000 RepID=A0ABX7K0F6_9PSED|nr:MULTISPECIES: PTS transporter subunit EIIB [Pseudomonas]MBN0976183.1 PTS transporter subunit EIIB [Pseudomonas hygromyciniae]NMX93351.1 PTS transporter subunit EIIB [Pseudomonas sp. WS 5086]NMY46029.1 PTS transporter subunit EIIB [Pseudomonas sp. WS 5027]QSB40798.1 PTS transporter subunit EIIB [Pseudomonas hygromyciniae]
MFEKLQQAFWKALTPDLVAETPNAEPAADAMLAPAVLSALGGATNLKSQQRVALTRIRVQLQDPTLVDEMGLKAAGITAVMILTGGVVHLITGLS